MSPGNGPDPWAKAVVLLLKLIIPSDDLVLQPLLGIADESTVPGSLRIRTI